MKIFRSLFALVWLIFSVDGKAAELKPRAAADPTALCGNGMVGIAWQRRVFPAKDAPFVLESIRDRGTALVDYTAFNNVQYRMRQFKGLYTAVLIRDADLATFTPEQTWKLVDEADNLYQTYKDLMGGEPDGNDLTSIAFVQNCGAGCGYVGARGIELDPYFATGGVWFASATISDLHPFLTHEMAHNFDLWNRHILTGGNRSHAWTGFMQAYIHIFSQYGRSPSPADGPGLSPFNYMRAAIDSNFGPYAASATATWETCVRDEGCPDIDATKSQSGFALQVASFIGRPAVKNSLAQLRALANAPGLNLDTLTPEQKNDLLIKAFSLGAHTNLACVVRSLKWRMPAALETELNGLVGVTRCQDADGDGVAGLLGDPNDQNATIFPGAPELANGVDDDVNGLIDDLLVSETTDFPNSSGSARLLAIPSRVRGSHPTLSDDDQFKVTLATAGPLRLAIRSLGAFAGWVFLYEASGDWKSYVHVGANESSVLTENLAAGTWRFSVTPNNDSQPGNYELIVSSEIPWPTLIYAAANRTAVSNRWEFVPPAVPLELRAEPSLETKYWVSGFGWVASATSSGSAGGARAQWTAPEGVSPQHLYFRSQFFVNTFPASRVTEALLFVADTREDISRPGDPVVTIGADGGASPLGEEAAKVIDNLPDTKYLNFQKLNSGLIVIPSRGWSVVTGVALTSGNDAPERDPATYILYGSSDGVGYFEIQRQTVPAFDNRGGRQLFNFTNTNACSSYKFIVTSVRNASIANSMQLAELELLGQIVAAPPPSFSLAVGSVSLAATLNINGASGNTIQVQKTDSFNPLAWTTITNFTLTSGQRSWTDPISATNRARFYRIFRSN